MPADLHIHSNLSDGFLSPEDIVKKAGEAGLTTISITDHDTVAGVDRAIEAVDKAGMKLIPGIEFSTDLPDTEIHILGYFIDHKADWFRALLRKIMDDRISRIHRTVGKLNDLGIDIKVEDVLKLADVGSVGRPHVARALMEKGAVGSIQEAFNRYLDMRSPAYVPHFKLTPYQAIETIVKAGGIPVYAHPGVSKKDEMIPSMMEKGLAGIEAYYCRQNKAQEKHYLSLAKKYGLLVTGGSDFHGLGTGRDILLGDMKLPDSFIDKLEEFRANGAARANIR